MNDTDFILKQKSSFMQYKNLQSEVPKTTGLQPAKLHNKNDSPGSKNP